MKKAILATLFLFALSGWCQDITYHYATHGGHDLYLDIYQPEHPRADSACVMYVFGGGFFEGARNEKGSVKCCQTLVDQGFTVVSIDYRLGLRDVQFDTVHLLKAYRIFDRAITIAVEDCSAAIRFLCQHADELNINPQRIVLTGSSAGAITVLQTDYCRANQLTPAADIPQGFMPAAVIPYAGAIFCGNRDLKYATTPAPTCFFHGVDDRIVNYNRFRSSLHNSLFGANKVEKVFDKKGYNHAIFRYEDRGHDVAAYLPTTIHEFCAFVDIALSSTPMAIDATCSKAPLPPYPWGKQSIFQLYMK